MENRNQAAVPTAVRFYPCRLKGTLTAPASKSDMHRALLLSALCETGSSVHAHGVCGDDVLATAACIRELGGSVSRKGDVWQVTPCKRGGNVLLDCGESGTTLRFLLPVAPLFADECRFTGRGRLSERPVAPLLEALSANGVTFSGGTLPFTMTGRPRAGEYTLPGNVSSQFISALLIAAPLMGGPTAITVTGRTESLGYIDMTRDTMARFGVETVCHTCETGRVYTVDARGYTAPASYETEGDWSAATPFAALAQLGHDICFAGLNEASRQPDAQCRLLFKRAGCGEAIDVSGCPDAMPALAALAACVEGETRITGAARLRLKESDRLASMADVLTKLGVRVQEQADGLTVWGGTVHGGTVDAHNDHRVAMALAALACEADAPVMVNGFNCVEKSRPDFLSAFGALGGQYDELTLR